MTKVLFYRENGVFYGFEEHGHAGYGEFDNDIVCAALSSMTFLIINTIELAYSSDVEYTMEDDDADIMVRAKAALPQFEADERKRYAISGLFMAYYYQLNDMTEEYYDYIEVDVIDKPYEK